MTKDETPLLSKSRFMAGLQCSGRLYSQCFQRELATPPDAARQARFDAGTRIGELARRLYLGGAYISKPFFQHAQAVERTREELESARARPIFEGGFPEDGLRVRVAFEVILRAAL